MCVCINNKNDNKKFYTSVNYKSKRRETVGRYSLNIETEDLQTNQILF